MAGEALRPYGASRHVERANPAGAGEDPRALKKDGELVEAIFLTIVPNDELPPGASYSLLVRIVAREASLLDTALEQRLERLAERMTALFRKCKGVTLLGECSVVSDEEFTFADVSRSVEWDVYDDLSYRAESEAADGG